MKRTEVVEAIENLKQIKQITDKEEYLISSAVNQRYNKIINILDNELKRMDASGVEVNSPAIKLLKHNPESDTTFTDAINKELQQLVLNNYKIIDYGIIGNDSTEAFIKYTN